MAGGVEFSQINGWAVTSQAPDQVIVSDSGQVQTGTQVYFATENGNTGSVFVPDQHYTVKKVHASIGIRAKVIDEIGSLTAGSVRQ